MIRKKGGGLDVSDATATAADIVAGTTAYISTGKTTGTLSKSVSTPENSEHTIPVSTLSVQTSVT